MSIEVAKNSTEMALAIGNDITGEISAALVSAKALVAVASDGEARTAATHITGLKKLVKLVGEVRKSATEELDKVKKAAIAKEREITGPIENEIARLDGLAKTYLLEMDRQREAKRKEELAKAEAEAQRQADEAQRQADADAALGLTDANPVQPGAVAPEPAPAIVMPERTTAPLVSGVKLRETWDFEIEDPHAIPRQFCSPDEALIRNHIKASKSAGLEFENLTPIPGVKFKVTKTIVG